MSPRLRDLLRSVMRPGRELRAGRGEDLGKGGELQLDAPFDLDEWVCEQKRQYGSREGLGRLIESRASRFNGDLLGLSGTIIDVLVHQRPCMVPKCFWGGDVGWRSGRRRERWEYLLTRRGIRVGSGESGLLVRFYMNASEWVPHPYAPPHWATVNFELFSRYIAPNKDAFELCFEWRTQNSIALSERLADRLAEFPVAVGASYRCVERTDYADVAFLMRGSLQGVLQVKPIWKRETALAELIKRIFTDAQREYSPPWLAGQRLDVFIPSLNVAVEYQGQQHYKAVEYFGGKEGLRSSRRRDQKKAKACKDAGVSLIEWKFTEPISEALLRKKVAALGIDWPEIPKPGELDERQEP